ncbi:isopentenyl-diphosphate Delta-isomerase [Cellulomonas sp. URHE0023]|uniref:isopentenyl-diphosphate Delta-isomerase n=1 Tax=Cellulomonas sp. URHE0023 TaxID=1380354 RepID=UPI000481BA75|nr:isopentenyl-diphosphate Delta-isomerase [Cellulomonas sp. URHE0023]
MTATASTDDLVVLLDEVGAPCGTAPRRTVHSATTPLHLAFSCYLFSPTGLLLVTRRALSKTTWPGVWTNSFCGHPRPGEPMADAIERHAWTELGVEVEDVEPLLPDFRYRATDAGGVVENEFCPVWFAVTHQEPTPNPDEVAELRWVSTVDLGRAVAAAGWAFSPWMVDQVRQLAELVPAEPERLARAS